jgi:hypothetical protein
LHFLWDVRTRIALGRVPTTNLVHEQSKLHVRPSSLSLPVE